MSLYLAAGIVVVLLLGAVGVQTKRVELAKADVVARTVEAKAYESRLRESTDRAKALQVSMDKLVSNQRELRALRGAVDRKIKEVERNDEAVRDWTHVRAPDAINDVMRNRRSRIDKTSSSGAADSPVPAVRAPDKGAGSERGLVGAAS